MIEQNFIKFFETSFKENWSLPAFTNYEEAKTYSIADVAKWVAKVHLLLDNIGVEQEDKISLIAKDSAEWCMTWLGIVTYGAVIVPILPAFHGEDIRHIIRHSDSKYVFVGEEHKKLLQLEAMSDVIATFDVKTLKPIAELTRSSQAVDLDADQLYSNRYPNGLQRDEIQLPEISNDRVVVISYTSGTSGFSKGVMTTANNLAANIVYALTQNIIKTGRPLLCFLPNAHAYGCAFNFLLPVIKGAHAYILDSKPTPTVLMKAFKDVRPHAILMVPLVLEKIYKNAIAPKLKKKSVRFGLKVPIINKIIYKKIRESLIEVMGGDVEEVIIGGAPLNDEVAHFLSKAKFPYMVGYGMTECAPLVCYAKHEVFVAGSCGKVLDLIEEVRLYDPEEVDGHMVGEVQVRGENVCKGYYNDPKKTEELFTADGWMRTGDSGYLDKNRNLFLRGRKKSMILGANGQNIYPEEIEAKISLLPYMSESILVSRDGHKRVAIVTMDEVALKRDGLDNPQDRERILKENRLSLNQNIASFASVAAFELLDGDFEKTPKQSIKRYLYE